MSPPAKKVLKRLARGVVGEYELYLLYRLDRERAASRPGDEPRPSVRCSTEPGETVARAAEEEIREQAWYGGEGSRLFVARREDRIVGTLWCWHGERYRARGFIELGDDEAKIVHLYTLPAARGQGVAGALLRHASDALLGEGFRALLARVWITNRPSRTVFRRAGFRSVAFIAVLRPWPGRRPRRVEITSPAWLRRLDPD